jgi:hypothetical protein
MYFTLMIYIDIQMKCYLLILGNRMKNYVVIVNVHIITTTIKHKLIK